MKATEEEIYAHYFKPTVFKFSDFGRKVEVNGAKYEGEAALMLHCDLAEHVNAETSEIVKTGWVGAHYLKKLEDYANPLRTH